MIRQRQDFEDALRIGASNLSNKTDASLLIKLLKVSAFLDNQELSFKLLDYLKSKVSQLENDEIATLHSSLVLVK